MKIAVIGGSGKMGKRFSLLPAADEIHRRKYLPGTDRSARKRYSRRPGAVGYTPDEFTAPGRSGAAFPGQCCQMISLIKSRDKQGFKDSLVALKQKFSDINIDFGRAYENIYKTMEWL